ncbi:MULTISPECIES: signal peptidase I [unclassified Sphingomonas]|jgi:signal peptidase I|uniref:signal peptidase I n=1 Tax=unclassified Sphingomonas TaxID=196159 RepID=UPI000ADEDC24|nr:MULTISPECIES: signal peptidase I [unclassified Sphingomonas]
MENTSADSLNEKPAAAATATEEKPKNEWKDLGVFLVKLALIVFVVRSFIFSPFSIPSESMLPRLLIGDYLFITKWNYGYSRHSLPWSVPLIPGRIFGGTPNRGDVVVFKAPGHNGEDWIKRVIGLPGDSVQMVNGQLILNGQKIPKQQIANFTVPISPNYPVAGPENDYHGCKTDFVKTDDKGVLVCSVPQFRETLPGGKTYGVLDQAMLQQDNTPVYHVPQGHVFLMGDNRDNSTDSRFDAPPPGATPEEAAHYGISYVPLENLEGKAVVNFWSTDGSANWFLPWTWFTAARWSRIGEGF